MRYFLVIILIFFLAGCSDQRDIEPISSEQKKILSYLSDASRFVMYLNLNELRDNEFWKGYFKNPIENDKSSSWLTDFEKKTGVGLKSGISEIFTADAGTDKITVIKFDKNQNKIKEYFGRNFVRRETEGKVYFQNKAGNIKYFFINESTLFIGNKDFPDNFFNKNYKSLNDNRELTLAINEIQFKDQYWIITGKGSYASLLLEKLTGVNKDLPVKELLRSINNISLSAEFTDGVEIASNWNCSSSKNAYLLSTAIKGALAMDLLSASDPLLAKTLEKMDVDRNSSNINFHLILNQNDINDLRNIAKKNNLQKIL